MMLRDSICLTLSLASIAACNSGSPPPAATPTGPAAAGACDLLTTGPLVGYSYQTMPPPVAKGGAVADGTYDLVQIVDHTKASGEWSSNNAPAFRWALRFTTEDRSSNHVEGRLLNAIDIPPARRCDDERFATIGTEIRIQDPRGELHPEAYSVTGDGLLLLKSGATFVFRRRP